MNNRIRELAEQAGFYFYDMHNVDGQDLGETVEADSWRVPEAFAKLILTEVCFDMINSHIDMSKVNRIAQHWGLEKFDEHS